MKVGDLVGWRSDLMYGLPDENPMIIIEESSLSAMWHVASPTTGWKDWVSEDEISIISSSEH